jgi:hypothetical protein
MHYLKPGALAQLRDAQRSARLYPSPSPDGNSLGFCYDVYKKRKSRRLHKDADAEEGEEHDEDDTPARLADVRRLVAIQSNNHGVVADQALNAPAVSHDMTPGPVVRVFGPLCPQRKKLLAPKASFATQPSASPSFSSPLPPSEELNYAGESLLESIPLELLVSTCFTSIGFKPCLRFDLYMLSCPFTFLSDSTSAKPNLVTFLV